MWDRRHSQETVGIVPHVISRYVSCALVSSDCSWQQLARNKTVYMSTIQTFEHHSKIIITNYMLNRYFFVFTKNQSVCIRIHTECKSSELRICLYIHNVCVPTMDFTIQIVRQPLKIPNNNHRTAPHTPPARRPPNYKRFRGFQQGSNLTTCIILPVVVLLPIIH